MRHFNSGGGGDRCITPPAFPGPDQRLGLGLPSRKDPTEKEPYLDAWSLFVPDVLTRVVKHNAAWLQWTSFSSEEVLGTLSINVSLAGMPKEDRLARISVTLFVGYHIHIPQYFASPMYFNQETKLTDNNSPSELSPTQVAFGAIAPKFAQLSDVVLFDDVWERPQLSKRDRSLITVAALTALYRLEQLPLHLERAQDNGLSREELAEAATHLAFYAGWPAAASALNLLEKSPDRT